MLGRYRWPVIRSPLLNVGAGVGFYAAFVYAVTDIRDVDRVPEGLALWLNSAAIASMLLVLPPAAWLSDRCGRRPVMIGALDSAAIPLFHLIHNSVEWHIALGEAGFVVIMGLVSGGTVAANVELIPAPVRCTGFAFTYNASIGYCGGSTLLIAATLIAATGNAISPAYWSAAAATVSLLTAVFLVRETRFEPLA